MKRKIMLIITLILILPIKISSLEYNSKLSGNDKIYSKTDLVQSYRAYTDLYIDITNIENIGSFEMYVSYDNNLVGLSTCNLLNYIATGCSITSDRKVFYNYKYSSDYEIYFNKYSFFRVVFMPKDTTPQSGTTTVEVSFKNAKDKDQNPISISSSSKTYTFSKYGMSLNIKEEDSSEETIKENNNAIIENNLNKEINKNIEVNNKEYQKSNNNYISKLEIENYELDFDKEKTEYEIYISNDENKLNIILELDDINSKYEVIGANDLKLNDYKVLIKVTAENGDNKIYTIKAEIKDKSNNKDEKVEKTEVIEEKIDNKSLFIIGILLSVVVLIIIIIFIILYKKNKQEDKLFEKL